MDIVALISHIAAEQAPVIICCAFGGLVRMLRNHSKTNRPLQIWDSVVMLLTSVFVGAICYPYLKKYLNGGEISTALLAIGYLSQDIIDRIMGFFSKKINDIMDTKENGNNRS